ncbi:MAG TPA: VWA domain-containing protein [Vicinamibacterales bacterium]|nr:VWA domain-containing protein [Vicinamibacterales bacterium]
MRVVDAAGRPVTDLTETDFTILEDGVAQTIRHFARQPFTARVVDTGEPRLRRATNAFDVEAQDGRVFLILLGQGRLQHPARGVDGLLQFVRERLLPQDLVAVMYWNRASDFTTDHEAVAALLERFRVAHGRVAAGARQQFSGLAGAYGRRAPADTLQRRIDAIFDGPGARRVAPAAIADDARRRDDERRVGERLEGTSPLDTLGEARTGELTVSLDEFVSEAAETGLNLGSLYAAIEYLRHIAGEKHLIFMSESLLSLPRQEDGDSLAAIAADARVAIHAVSTGGLPSWAAGRMSRGVMSHGGTGSVGLSARDQRAIAELTGGQGFAFVWARDALARIAETTSFSYVLGYYPTNQDWNGRQRRIQVRVNRPGVRVLYRHSYFASPDLRPLDSREFRTHRRVLSAGLDDRPIPDIGLTVGARYADVDVRTVTVDVRIAADRLSVRDDGGRRIGHVTVAVFVGDLNENLIGEAWQDIDLRVLPASWDRMLAEGIPYSVTIPVPRGPSYVKVIVYDADADLLGSRTVGVRR